MLLRFFTVANNVGHVCLNIVSPCKHDKIHTFGISAVNYKATNSIHGKHRQQPFVFFIAQRAHKEIKQLVFTFSYKCYFITTRQVTRKLFLFETGKGCTSLYKQRGRPASPYWGWSWNTTTAPRQSGIGPSSKGRRPGRKFRRW